MTTSAQQLVNGLSARIGRPAVVEDVDLHLIAYGPHHEPIDHVREASILNHGASSEVREYLTAYVRDATGPVRVPENEPLGMLARLCIPIRANRTVLGYLWFVDPDQAITGALLDDCLAAARDLAPMLAGDAPEGRFGSRSAELVSVLLSSSPETAAIAGRSLRDSGFLQGGRGAVVAVFDGIGLPPNMREVVRAALKDPTSTVPVGHVVTTTMAGRCVVVVSGVGPGRSAAALVEQIRTRATAQRVPSLATATATATAASAATAIGTATASGIEVGISAPRLELAELPAAYREALSALRAAQQLPGVGPMVDWGDLGFLDTLLKVAVSPNAAGAVHQGLVQVFALPEARSLLETVETYLDLGGNTQAAAEQLTLHRTSLYYRLQRFEQLTGASLKNGVDRLTLHLSIKIARMAGLFDLDDGDGAERPPVPLQRVASR